MNEESMEVQGDLTRLGKFRLKKQQIFKQAKAINGKDDALYCHICTEHLWVNQKLKCLQLVVGYKIAIYVVVELRKQRSLYKYGETTTIRDMQDQLGDFEKIVPELTL